MAEAVSRRRSRLDLVVWLVEHVLNIGSVLSIVDWLSSLWGAQTIYLFGVCTLYTRIPAGTVNMSICCGS